MEGFLRLVCVVGGATAGRMTRFEASHGFASRSPLNGRILAAALSKTPFTNTHSLMPVEK